MAEATLSAPCEAYFNPPYTRLVDVPVDEHAAPELINRAFEELRAANRLFSSDEAFVRHFLSQQPRRQAFEEKLLRYIDAQFDFYPDIDSEPSVLRVYGDDNSHSTIAFELEELFGDRFIGGYEGDIFVTKTARGMTVHYRNSPHFEDPEPPKSFRLD